MFSALIIISVLDWETRNSLSQSKWLNGKSIEILYHLCLASRQRDISKHCRHRSDAAERSIYVYDTSQYSTRSLTCVCLMH